MCPAHIPWLENGIAVRCLWPEPLGCFSRLPASICPVLLVSPLLWDCPIHGGGCGGGSPHPACAVPCVSAVLLNLLSQIVFATNWSLGPLLYMESPLQSKEQMGTLLTGGECPSPPAAVEGAGRSWSYTPGWFSSFWRPGLLHSTASVQGPLSALRGGSGQGEQVITPGLSLSKGIDTTSDNQCFPTLLPCLACPRLRREVKPDTKSLADVLWSPLKRARTEMGRMEGLVQLSSNLPSRGGPRALSAGPGVFEGFG